MWTYNSHKHTTHTAYIFLLKYLEVRSVTWVTVTCALGRHNFYWSVFRNFYYSTFYLQCRNCIRGAFQGRICDKHLTVKIIVLGMLGKVTWTSNILDYYLETLLKWHHIEKMVVPICTVSRMRKYVLFKVHSRQTKPFPTFQFVEVSIEAFRHCQQILRTATIQTLQEGT